jgi:hypothetical protein
MLGLENKMHSIKLQLQLQQQLMNEINTIIQLMVKYMYLIELIGKQLMKMLKQHGEISLEH